jgi:hypothetical protein
MLVQVVVSIYQIFKIQIVGVFMIQLQTKFHVPVFNGSSVTAMKLDDKCVCVCVCVCV